MIPLCSIWYKQKIVVILFIRNKKESNIPNRIVMIQRYPINAVLDIRGHCTDLHLVRKRLFHDMPKPKLLLNVN